MSIKVGPRYARLARGLSKAEGLLRRGRRLLDHTASMTPLASWASCPGGFFVRAQ